MQQTEKREITTNVVSNRPVPIHSWSTREHQLLLLQLQQPHNLQFKTDSNEHLE